jgi:hypothetical protein
MDTTLERAIAPFSSKAQAYTRRVMNALHGATLNVPVASQVAALIASSYDHGAACAGESESVSVLAQFGDRSAEVPAERFRELAPAGLFKAQEFPELNNIIDFEAMRRKKRLLHVVSSEAQ